MQPNHNPQEPIQGWQPQPQPSPQPTPPSYEDPYAALTPPSDASVYAPQPSYQAPAQPYAQPYMPPQPQHFPGQPYRAQEPAAPQPNSTQAATQSLNPSYARYDDPAPHGQRPPSDFELRFRQHVQSTIAEPPKRKPKIWPFALGFLLLLILGGGGAAAYFVLQNQQPTAEERLQYALSAHLQTPYINQDYDIHLGSDDTGADIKVKSSLDVSDPTAPKLSGSYTMSSDKTADQTVHFVSTSKTKAYASFDKADTLGDKTIKANTWYSYDPSDAAARLVTDPFDIIGHIGTARGEVPVGKFSETQQATILSQIASANPYTITNVADDGSALRYDLTLNSENVNKLDAIVAKLIGEDTESQSDSSTHDAQMQLWIDKQTNRITKVFQKKDIGTTTITITYPPHYEGTAPRDSLDLRKALETPAKPTS